MYGGAIIAGGMAAVLLGLPIAGCGGSLDREKYVAANLRLLNALPLIAGAREVETSSSPYRGSEIESAPTIGYGTTRIFRLPRSISAFEAVAFYRAKLHRSWVVVDVSAAPSLSLRKGDAYVHVLAGRGNVFVEVDHDCYKGGPFPRCFGP